MFTCHPKLKYFKRNNFSMKILELPKAEALKKIKNLS